VPIVPLGRWCLCCSEQNNDLTKRTPSRLKYKDGDRDHVQKSSTIPILFDSTIFSVKRRPVYYCSTAFMSLRYYNTVPSRLMMPTTASAQSTPSSSPASSIRRESPATLTRNTSLYKTPTHSCIFRPQLSQDSYPQQVISPVPVMSSKHWVSKRASGVWRFLPGKSPRKALESESYSPVKSRFHEEF
jgi:hypothetical protein